MKLRGSTGFTFESDQPADRLRSQIQQLVDDYVATIPEMVKRGGVEQVGEQFRIELVMATSSFQIADTVMLGLSDYLHGHLTARVHVEELETELVPA